MSKFLTGAAFCVAGVAAIFIVQAATDTPVGWYTYVMSALWGIGVSSWLNESK